MSTQHATKTVDLLASFDSSNLGPELAAYAGDFQGLAHGLVARLPDSDDLTAGLHHLREAQKCAVRAAASLTSELVQPS